MHLNNQRGVSLISVLVAVAILGVVISGTTTLLNQFVMGQSFTRFSSESIYFQQGVRTLLSNTAACTQTFLGLNLAVPNTVTRLKDQAGTDVYTTGAVYGDRTFILTSVTLDSFTSAPPPGRATVTLRFDATTQVLGPSTLAKSIDIQVSGSGSPGNLVSCTALGGVTFPLWANPIGSAAAPAYSFQTDSNTGMFSPAADTLAFATGGAEVVRMSPVGVTVGGYTLPMAAGAAGQVLTALGGSAVSWANVPAPSGCTKTVTLDACVTWQYVYPLLQCAGTNSITFCVP
jgi:hypothetical protein